MRRTLDLKRNSAWVKLASIERWVATDRGLLTLIWVLRFVVLLWLTLYFVANQGRYSESMLLQIRTALLAFFTYVVISGIGGTYYAEWLLLRRVKLAQVAFEIVLYSMFYYLTQDPRSEVYLLYFLPLFAAVRYLGTHLVLGVFGLASFCLSAALIAIGGPAIMEVYPPREFFMVAMTLFFVYALRRRTSVIEDVREEKSQLISVLQGFADGVYVVDRNQRLLFVNDVLQTQHGPYTRGDLCSSYFLCRDQLCGWCPSSESLADLYDVQKQEGTFVDQDGHPYRVEVSACPLPDENGQVVGAIVFVRDVSKQKQILQRLIEQLRRTRRQARDLTSERAKWFETIKEMGKRLAGFDDLEELMQFVVEETRKRLNAETSALFLIENDRLVRRAIAGIEKDWFPTESYGIGEGITGQAIVPQNGAKYGEPVLENDVDESPIVIARHLAEYREKLSTREVKHLIAVPLNGQEGSFGVLRVVNKLDVKGLLSSEGFQPEDVDFLVTLASMVAIATENTRLLSEARQRLREIETLYTVSQRITQPLDLPELLQVIVDEARKTIPRANKASVYLINDRTGALVSKAVSEPVSQSSGQPPLRSDEGIAGRAIKERRTVYVPDTRKDSEFRPRGTLLLSLLVAPLIVDNGAIGILSVDSDQSDAFTPDDRRLFDALAAHAAITIEKAQLYKREREKRRLADTLREVSKAVNSSLNLDEVLQYILHELRKVVAYDTTSIQLLEEDRLRIIACHGFDEPNAVKNIAFPADDPNFPNYEVVATKMPRIVGDVRLHYPHFFEEGEKYHSKHIRSWLGVPLVYRARVIGMISLDKKTPNYYTDDHASSALTFANQVAMAIENAQLFEKTRQQVEELDKLYQASQVVTSSLDILEVLKNIVSLAGEVADSDHTGVVLVGEDGTLITSVEDHEVGAPLHIRARSNGTTRQIIKAATPLIFDEVQDDGITHNPAIIQQGFKAYAGIPIIARGQAQGVLFVHSFKPGAFGTRKSLLRTFCNQAAIAIENAKLFQEAENQAAMLAKLVKASSGLIEHTSLEELYKFCVENGAKIFDVEDCSLYVKNEDRQTIDLVASSGIPDHVWTKREALIKGPGLTAYVVRSCETLNFGGDEFKDHPAWAGRHEEPFLEHLQHLPSKRCHSLLIGPLADSKGHCVGVLKLENRCGEGAGERFSAFEEALHKTFASHIGIAIERAKLYHQLDEEARRQARESLSDDLHELMSLLHGTLVLGTAYTEELVRGNDYVAARRQLSKMVKAAKNVYEGLRRIRQDVRDTILQEEGLIPALKHYANVLQIPVTFQVVGRAALPSELEYTLYKLAQEALNNVKRHAQLRENKGQATVTLEKTPESFQLTVQDTGVGFDALAILNRSDAFGFQSMKRWAKSIGAKLEVTSQLNHGTCVRVYGRVKEARDGR